MLHILLKICKKLNYFYRKNPYQPKSRFKPMRPGGWEGESIQTSRVLPLHWGDIEFFFVTQQKICQNNLNIDEP